MISFEPPIPARKVLTAHGVVIAADGDLALMTDGDVRWALECIRLKIDELLI